MLKCQFHAHCSGDPVDHVNYSAKKLIDEAVKLKYDVLCITLHRKFFFNKKIQQYASKKGLHLIPGVEFEINGKHILAINTDPEISTVDNFEKLAAYRKSHPDCLIIAPHPFFPTNYCLQNDLINNIQLFDAIEISWAYTKIKDYNQKAIALAKEHKKPLVATADCHILAHLNNGYTFVESQKDTKSIIKAIRANKIKIHSKSTSHLKILRFFMQLSWQNFMAKLKK